MVEDERVSTLVDANEKVKEMDEFGGSFQFNYVHEPVRLSIRRVEERPIFHHKRMLLLAFLFHF